MNPQEKSHAKALTTEIEAIKDIHSYQRGYADAKSEVDQLIQIAVTMAFERAAAEAYETYHESKNHDVRLAASSASNRIRALANAPTVRP